MMKKKIVKSTLIVTFILFLCTTIFIGQHQFINISEKKYFKLLLYNNKKTINTTNTTDFQIDCSIETNNCIIVEKTAVNENVNLVEFEKRTNKEKKEKKGILVCDGQQVDSEVVYWKIIDGDESFQSSVDISNFDIDHYDDNDNIELHQTLQQQTQHQREQAQEEEQYLTVDYDHGGWNNMRMALECAVVLAHAMNRTFVVPPLQHIYLLTELHKDDVTTMENRDGYEEFYDINLLKKQKNLKVITMKQFLEIQQAKSFIFFIDIIVYIYCFYILYYHVYLVKVEI
jgi:hypothetical protein